MRKDFDGNSWANKNKDDFSRLIADARRKKTTAPPKPEVDQQGEKSAPTPDLEKGEEPDHSTVPSAPVPDQQAAQVQSDGNQEPPPQVNGQSPYTMSTSEYFRHNTELNSAQQERTPPATGQDPLVPPAPIGMVRKESHDYHINQHEGSEPCELPSHLATSSVRKVPMFSLPQESSRDQ
jgi:hypothetical protein